MKISGIYSITNILSGKKYIGYSINIKRRWKCHKVDLRSNNHGNEHLQKSWNKYGEENFKFEILEECSESILPEREHYWATLLDVHNIQYGYNIQPTNCDGRMVISQQTREKISKSLRESTKAKAVRHILAAKRKGMKFSEEVRLKMSKSSYVYPIIALTINGQFYKEYESVVSASKTLNIHTPNILRVLSGKGKHIHGYIFVRKEEYNPDINYSRKLDIKTKPLLQYKNEVLIKEYESVKDACIAMKVSKSAVTKCMKGNWKCKGYNWKYKTEENGI